VSSVVGSNPAQWPRHFIIIGKEKKAFFMFPHTLISSESSEGLKKAMSVWNHQVVEDQNVDLICSDIVACCVITEDAFLRGHQFIQEKVSYLQDFPKGIVFLVSSSLHSNTDEIQLILTKKMKLQAFPVASLDRAAEVAERFRKMGNSNPKKTRKKSELSATPPVEALSSINNVSRKRAQALLESVGSCKKIAMEPESEIAAVKGIGRSAASSINEFFQQELN
jgi:hypothetical protein